MLVAHSTSELAARHLHRPPAATEDLVAAVRRVLAVDQEPEWTHVQRWSFARARQPRDEPFHLGAARTGLCGDGWGSPRVETAWLSGHLLGERLATELS